jgi:hypothetical protein
LVVIAALAACKAKDPPPVSGVFYDTFEREELGPNWNATGDGYRIVNGQLSAKGSHNHPLWLKKKLPRNVRIEFDAWSTEKRGDLKVEVFGDGQSFDPDKGRYLATSYVAIFGGWGNSKSMLARLDEHIPSNKERSDVKVVPGQHYHWRIERRANTLTWYVDDMAKPFLQYDDPEPLEGEGHEFFAFNNWETDTWFDNLVITAL